jgi:hypothetical protein
VKLKEPIKEMFCQEFRNRASMNQPTLLEKYSLSDEDFDGLCNMLHILKPLQSAQRALERDKYVSISLVPYIFHQLQIELEGCLGAASPDTQNDLISLLDKMIDDFNSRWGEEPRSGAASFFPESSDEEMDDAGVDGDLLVEEIVANEIWKYQSDRGLPLQTDGCYNFPLEWWMLHHTDYPHNWKVAEQILAIPATSAPSERVFSSAANIVDKKRVRLKPENVDLLVFLRGNKDFVDWA